MKGRALHTDGEDADLGVNDEDLMEVSDSVEEGEGTEDELLDPLHLDVSQGRERSQAVSERHLSAVRHGQVPRVARQVSR